jgi:predicted nucleic acid-binding protein
MFVLDCSVTMAWCFADEASDYADKVLDCLETQTVYVPRLWHLEVLNILLVAERRGRITQAESSEFLDTLKQLDIQTDALSTHINSPDALELGREYLLSAYDAAYVALAVRENLPVATMDKKMQEIARQLGLYFSP